MDSAVCQEVTESLLLLKSHDVYIPGKWSALRLNS
jgi:hypothetical protein